MDFSSEIMINEEKERVIQFKCESRDLFDMVKGLQERGRTVHFRCFDAELNDWTCWQHLVAS